MANNLIRKTSEIDSSMSSFAVATMLYNSDKHLSETEQDFLTLYSEAHDIIDSEFYPYIDDYKNDNVKIDLKLDELNKKYPAKETNINKTNDERNEI